MRSRDRMCVGIGALALLASTLLLGGVFRWAQALVAGLVALALLTQITSQRKLDRVSPIVSLFVVAMTLTALQLVPLPHAIISVLDGPGASLRASGAQLAGTEPWQCLSMDPPATLRALIFLSTLFGVALLGLRLGTSERGRFMLIGGVAITCGIVALVTGLHAIVSADSIYGYYQVSHRLPIVGVFVNLNHLGCLMAFGAAIATGLAFFEKQSPTWRALWVVIAVGCSAITLLTESRGATVALALGLATTGVILVGQRLGEIASSRRQSLSMGRLPVVIVLVLGFGLAMYSSAGGVAEQLDRTSLVEVEHPTSKFAAWKSSIDLIREAPWLGVGRGAMEPMFTHVFPSSAQVTFAPLENEYIQSVVDWGVVGSIFVFAAFGWCVVAAFRKRRDGPLAAAAIGGLAGVVFQSSVDFGVEILGVAVPVTIVATTLLGVPLRETSRKLGLRAWRLGLIAVLGLGVWALLSDRTKTLAEEHDAMFEKRPTREEITAVIERHPVDYFAFGVASEVALRDKDPKAVLLLDHAMRLHPYQPGLHRVAARLLLANGQRAQAAVEYSLAMTGSNPHRLLVEILRSLPITEDAAAAIPLDYPNTDTILKSLAELQRTDVSQRWLMRKTIEHPSQDLVLIDKLYELASARHDYETALQAANLRLGIVNTHTSHLMLAKIYYKQKNYAAVYEKLADVAKWQGRLDERADAWLIVCDCYREESKWDPALKCLHQLDASGTMATRRAAIVERVSDINDRRTNEIRTKQIQDLERSMNLPIDTDLPVLHGSGPQEPVPNPLTKPAITNPIKNPLNPNKPPTH